MPDDTGHSPTPDPPWSAFGQWKWVVAFWLLIGLGSLWFLPPQELQVVSYSALKQMIRDGAVVSAELQDHAITVGTRAPGGADPVRYQAVTPVQADPDLLPLLESEGVEITATKPQGISILSYLLPWAVILGIYFWFQRRMMGRIAGGLGPGTGALLGGVSQSQAHPPGR
ncbi:ATP-dependent metallopeptidase FtsH/Yme1/Tma family protein [Limimaricola litoreus]|uniref:Peptidase M41 FtsH extracellular domain-containing protein n=1 Tax=Limimaricola litoreus TaxID=2955316 RepID=A0A9X2JQ05_9RHOB|nr:ATP-dependent metallopeptidase FtsH/Yme1/Tma family protein [Limimaricola litoreus]MCP1168810.1 hypothetical protein [Limimaricola litoreus]